MPVDTGTVLLDRDLNDKVVVRYSRLGIYFLGYFSALCRTF